MIRSVILSASNSCFVACPGCYNHFGDSIADTTAVIAFVAELHHRIGLEKITVGGGDPLTRSDIVDLLAGLRALELRIHLDTVGTAFLRDAQVHFMGRGTTRQVDPAAVSRFVELLGIPLDGSTDEIFRRFRRFSSVTEQEKILTILDTVGAAVCVNTVVHQGNVADLERIASLILQHPSVYEWQLFQFMPIGPLEHHNRARFEISEEVFSASVNRLSEIVPCGHHFSRSNPRPHNRNYYCTHTRELDRSRFIPRSQGSS